MKVLIFLDVATGVQADPFIDEFTRHMAWVEEWMFAGEQLEVEVYYAPGDAVLSTPAEAVAQ